jgi:homocitrate synthase
MQTANNPISHHTSHTMGEGAASSNSGDNSCGANSVGHHTSHTMGQGASSSSSGAHGGGGVAEAQRVDNAIALGASLTDVETYENNENDNESDDASSLGDSLASLDGTAGSVATSMRSSGSLANFKIIDTTLREGEQFATAYFTTETKMKIAKALDDIGVEYLELTRPGSRPNRRRRLRERKR